MRSRTQLPKDVIDAINAGNNIEAIKTLRESTGLGLREAKEMLDAYIDGHPIPEIRERSEPVVGRIVLPSNVIAAIQAGQKIQAIKALRESHKLGLREAREMVEAFIDEHRELERLQRSGFGAGHFILLLIIIAIAYFVFK